MTELILNQDDACICGNNSVVECNLAKVEVAGSTPVSRSENFDGHDEVDRDTQNKRYVIHI